ncbi:MAG: efflux RND transporter permease subunit, partial [Myxococcota bacterium]
GEAIYRERELGVSSEEAAKRGLRRVGIPVISADLTTIAAFVPMLLMVGVMGQFMSVMPKVVAFALIGSVFADHLLLPAAAAKLGMRRPSRSRRLAPDGLPWFSPELPRMRRLYLSVLEGALRRRGTVIAMGAAAFALMLVVLGSGIVESVFLPYSDRGRFTVDYSLPSGTSLAETDRVGLLIAGHLGSLPEVKSYVLTTGDTGALATDMREGGRQGPEYGRFTVELVKRDDRARSQAEIVGELRQKLSNYAGLDVDVEELQEGPPVGAALAVQIQGPSLDELEIVARKVRDRVAGIPGVQDVRVDYERGKPEIRVDLNRTVAAASYGITSDQVARTLLTAFQGVEVGRMWLGEERVDVRLQASEAYPRTIDHIRELPLRTSSGEMIPLGEVAAVRFGLSPNAIFRKDTVRSITVRADAAADSSSVTLDSQARASLATLSLPPRVRIEFLGEKEERDRSYASLWQALKWGLLLIYIVMAVQFNSVIQPFIVLATIPLALVGVVLGLLLTGTPFSFMVFIGIVSLTGIVVNDGIVLIDAINRNREAGMPMLNAIRDAASTRLRPVLLTTVTTIFGILPLTLNLAEGGEFWVPLGIAIIAGLLVASVLTLVVVPVLYSILMGPRWTWRREPSHRTDPAHAPTPAGGAS